MHNAPARQIAKPPERNSRMGKAAKFPPWQDGRRVPGADLIVGLALPDADAVRGLLCGECGAFGDPETDERICNVNAAAVRVRSEMAGAPLSNVRKPPRLYAEEVRVRRCRRSSHGLRLL